jgi:hypothetical protein
MNNFSITPKTRPKGARRRAVVRFLSGAQDPATAYHKPRPYHRHVRNAAARTLGPICARGPLAANLLGGGEERARWAVVRFLPGAQDPAAAYHRPRPHLSRVCNAAARTLGVRLDDEQF